VRAWEDIFFALSFSRDWDRFQDLYYSMRRDSVDPTLKIHYTMCFAQHHTRPKDTAAWLIFAYEDIKDNNRRIPVGLAWRLLQSIKGDRRLTLHYITDMIDHFRSHLWGTSSVFDNRETPFIDPHADADTRAWAARVRLCERICELFVYLAQKPPVNGSWEGQVGFYAMKILGRIEDEGVEPTAAMLDSVLTAVADEPLRKLSVAGKHSILRNVSAIHVRFKRLEITPGIFALTKTMKVWSQFGQKEHVLKFFLQHAQQFPRDNPFSVYYVIVALCEQVPDVQLSEAISAVLQANLALDANSYQSLLMRLWACRTPVDRETIWTLVDILMGTRQSSGPLDLSLPGGQPLQEPVLNIYHAG
jgi:hypothetical protein